MRSQEGLKRTRVCSMMGNVCEASSARTHIFLPRTASSAPLKCGVVAKVCFQAHKTFPLSSIKCEIKLHYSRPFLFLVEAVLFNLEFSCILSWVSFIPRFRLKLVSVSKILFCYILSLNLCFNLQWEYSENKSCLEVWCVFPFSGIINRKDNHNFSV